MTSCFTASSVVVGTLSGYSPEIEELEMPLGKSGMALKEVTSRESTTDGWEASRMS